MGYAYGGRVLEDVADDAAARARAVARQLLVQREQVGALEEARGVRGRRVLDGAVVLQHRALHNMELCNNTRTPVLRIFTHTLVLRHTIAIDDHEQVGTPLETMNDERRECEAGSYTRRTRWYLRAALIYAYWTAETLRISLSVLSQTCQYWTSVGVPIK